MIHSILGWVVLLQDHHDSYHPGMGGIASTIFYKWAEAKTPTKNENFQSFISRPTTNTTKMPGGF